MTLTRFLDRDASYAEPGFNRWIIPPAAMAVHLSIGQIYALSVFSKPLMLLVGGSEPSPEDWSLAAVGWIFSSRR